jgi:hypothetical protein
LREDYKLLSEVGARDTVAALERSRHVMNAPVPAPNPSSTPPIGTRRAALSAREALRFALNANRRNLRFASTVTAVVALLGLALTSALPARYAATSKIVVSHRGINAEALASGARANTDDASNLRNVSELVLRPDSVLALTREAKLVARWPATRTWALKLKDALWSAVSTSSSSDDEEHRLAALLEGAISITPEGTGGLRFRVVWRDRQTSNDLAALMQRRFLAALKLEELAAITRAAAMLEQEQTSADRALEPAVRELASALGSAQKTLGVSTRANSSKAQPLAAGPIAPLELTEPLEQLRRSEREITEPWYRRGAETRLALAELRANHPAEHPMVRQAELRLHAVNELPVELGALQAQEAELLNAARHPALEEDLSRSQRKRDAARKLDDQDPAVLAARAHLEDAIRVQREIEIRLDRARTELASAQASFKYRYTAQPAEVAPRPIAPPRALYYIASLVIALLLGFASGPARDLLSGRILEPWQLRALGVELLAEAPLPSRRRR